MLPLLYDNQKSIFFSPTDKGVLKIFAAVNRRSRLSSCKVFLPEHDHDRVGVDVWRALEMLVRAFLSPTDTPALFGRYFHFVVEYVDTEVTLGNDNCINCVGCRRC
jgi:hypothetical protein